jgi:hypothetical protein
LKGDVPACVLTSEQEEGPYYIDGGKLRRDITEGKAGMTLTLRVGLLGAKRCGPLSSAAIDVWHCDAEGVYSGFTANSRDEFGAGGPDAIVYSGYAAAPSRRAEGLDISTPHASCVACRSLTTRASSSSPPSIRDGMRDALFTSVLEFIWAATGLRIPVLAVMCPKPANCFFLKMRRSGLPECSPTPSISAFAARRRSRTAFSDRSTGVIP